MSLGPPPMSYREMAVGTVRVAEAESQFQLFIYLFLGLSKFSHPEAKLA